MIITDLSAIIITMKTTCVYTIALNEIDHCERWANSSLQADYRIVADTGSTDGTPEKLRSLGVTVYDITQNPWRFDHARNQALALCPDDVDICISLDLDEYLMDGWRPAIESVWQKDTTRLAYKYVFDANTSMAGFWVNKIHSRHGYTWRRPVHETIFCTMDSEREAVIDCNLILQKQDLHKSSRSNYLPLLAIAHQEDPQDGQIAFWYARDLVYADDVDRAKIALKEFLDIPNTWVMERNESYRLLAQISPDQSEQYLLKAIAESTTRREPWLDLVKLYYQRQDWLNCAWSSLCGINARKTNTYLDYLQDNSGEFYDYGSISCWHLDWKTKARELVQQAAELVPHDTRIQNNRNFMVGK